MKNKFNDRSILFYFLFFLILSCTSKNRFENPQAEQPLPEEKNKLNLRNDNQAEVESNAVPFLEGIGFENKWKLKLSHIQTEIYEAQLTIDGKLHMGLLKHVTSDNPQNIGEFYIGEVNYNKEKNQVQFFMQTLECTDSDNKMHIARITMLWQEKQHYGCANLLL